MNRKLIPAAAVATCAAAVLALFAGPVNADDAPGPVPSPTTSPTVGPSAPATTRPTPVPPSTPHPGTPAPNTPAPQPSRTPTGLPGGGTGSSPAPGCARTVPQLAFLRGSCEDDLCVDVMRDRMDRSNEGAADIALTARHADDGTTLVSLDAG